MLYIFSRLSANRGSRRRPGFGGSSYQSMAAAFSLSSWVWSITRSRLPLQASHSCPFDRIAYFSFAFLLNMTDMTVFVKIVIADDSFRKAGICTWRAVLAVPLLFPTSVSVSVSSLGILCLSARATSWLFNALLRNRGFVRPLRLVCATPYSVQDMRRSGLIIMWRNDMTKSCRGDLNDYQIDTRGVNGITTRCSVTLPRCRQHVSR